MSPSLVVAISSRALFDLEESHAVFQHSLAEYERYQIEHEDDMLGPGVAFPLIKRLLALQDPHTGEPAVEVVLVSHNDANTGLRVLNSIEGHGLRISRAAFTRGRPPYPYLGAFQADLFLSADPKDVQGALEEGFAAGIILRGVNFADDATDELRIAFDDDAVLFSDEAERVYAEQGLAAFQRSEAENAERPLRPGPFKRFLEAINRIQSAFPPPEPCPIRTALVTARSAPAHRRAIKTLRAWGVSVDEAFFLGGMDKAPVLRVFRPHIYFDDQQSYCESASRYVPTAHVPAGIKNAEG